MKQDKVTTLPARFEPKFWESADGRSAIVRAVRQRVVDLQADCAADSFQKRLLCERTAFVALRLETLERDAVDGKSVDFGSYLQGVNTLIGLLRILGLERQARQVTDLQSHLASKRKGHRHG